jgi:hypothetical protein
MIVQELIEKGSWKDFLEGFKQCETPQERWRYLCIAACLKGVDIVNADSLPKIIIEDEYVLSLHIAGLPPIRFMEDLNEKKIKVEVG